FIKLPKLGYLRYRAGRKIVGKIKAVTIRKSSTNKYYAVLSLDCENQAIKRTNKKVGLDVGVSDLVITSDGQKYQTIRFDKLIEYKKHQWEKKLARRRFLAFKDIQKQKKLGLLEPKSLDQYRNYQKAKVMVAKYSEKVANQRKDYLHKITAELVNSYDTIVIEDIKTNELLKKHNLARAISNQSWRELRLMLEYKCAWYGKQLVVIDPYKTSQICSQCGYDDGKHELDVRAWTCPSCHAHHDRDINASKNILNTGLVQALVR
ncbi:RNA-guided endonuclease TnpB family protein, partial [Companilactobacillus kedongensis]|uniref:RNA-guided endonuclease TnpB family protein n=1 Tax=Companilactobacillus kedongensis TaxID=2486004 RepID=UPI0013DDB1DA